MVSMRLHHCIVSLLLLTLVSCWSAIDLDDRSLVLDDCLLVVRPAMRPVERKVSRHRLCLAANSLSPLYFVAASLLRQRCGH